MENETSSDGASKVATFRLSRERHKELNRMASENARSFSEEVNSLIEDGFAYRKLPNPLLPRKLQRDIAECALGFVLTEGAVPPEKVNKLSARLIGKRLKGSIALDVFIPALFAAVIASLLSLLIFYCVM